MIHSSRFAEIAGTAKTSIWSGSLRAIVKTPPRRAASDGTAQIIEIPANEFIESTQRPVVTDPQQKRGPFVERKPRVPQAQDGCFGRLRLRGWTQ